MGQLARRLAELAMEHAGGPRAWQPVIDRVGDLEKQGDHERAHALFLETRETMEKAHLRDLRDALASFAWLVDVPFSDPDVVPVKERQRLVRAFTRALADARALSERVKEAQRLAEGLDSRAIPADALAAFGRVPFSGLARAAEDAEALRRRVAAEARVQERTAEVVKRSRKLKVRRVDVPGRPFPAADRDGSEGFARVPDAQDAHRLLDAAEAALADAERVEGAAAAVRRELKDAAIGEFRSQSLRALKKRVEAAERQEDAEAAVAQLQALLAEAAALRKEAAALAQKAARARRSGRRAPERESRGASDDPAYL